VVSEVVDLADLAAVAAAVLAEVVPVEAGNEGPGTS
jgi:hypothetical protein